MPFWDPQSQGSSAWDSEIKTSFKKNIYIYIRKRTWIPKIPKGEREISCIQTIIFRIQIGFRGCVYGSGWQNYKLYTTISYQPRCRWNNAGGVVFVFIYLYLWCEVFVLLLIHRRDTELMMVQKSSTNQFVYMYVYVTYTVRIYINREGES